jgi:hypothetical protein
MGSSRSSRIYSFIATFPSCYGSEGLSPLPMRHSCPHHLTFGRVLSAQTMIPHSRGHRAQGRVGSVSVKRRVAPRFPSITTCLGSGGSVLAIRGFETAT